MFSKEEGLEMKEALTEVMNAMPKSKQMQYIGHFNSLFLFLDAAIRNAPPGGREAMKCPKCGHEEKVKP